MFSLLFVLSLKPIPPTSPDISFILFTTVALVLLGVVIGIVIGWILGKRNKSFDSLANSPLTIAGNLPQHTSNSQPTYPLQHQMRRSFADEVGAQTMSSQIQTPPKRDDEPLSTPSQPDDMLANKRWLGLVEECVALFDELDDVSSQLDPPRQEIIRHVEHRLQEILGRSGVETISRDNAFDMYRHKQKPADRAVAQGTPLTAIVSPGFAVGRYVLRPAQVKVTDPRLSESS